MKFKPLYYCLRYASLFLVVTFALNSCKKSEDTPVTLNFRTVSQLRADGNDYSYTTYYYDSQGRIEKTLGSQIYSNVIYTSDSAFYKEYQLNGNLNASYSMKLDAAGRFLNDGYQTYQYNSDGKLAKRTYILTPTTYIVHTWQDGDNVKEETYIGGELTYTTTYTYYTDKPNKAGWDYNHSGINCFFGRASKHLIKKSVTVDKNGVTNNDVDWTYELDSNGLPKEMKLSFNTLGTFDTYKYAYELAE